MQTNRIDRRSLTIWRIRISLVSLIPATVAAAFFAPFTVPWWWINGVWVTLYLFGFLFYFPLFCKNFTYYLDGLSLITTCGVFYRFQLSIPVARVQYVLRMQWPLARLFGVVTLVVQAAGGKITLMHLSAEEADRLQALLDKGGRQ